MKRRTVVLITALIALGTTIGARAQDERYEVFTTDTEGGLRVRLWGKDGHSCQLFSASFLSSDSPDDGVFEPIAKQRLRRGKHRDFIVNANTTAWFWLVDGNSDTTSLCVLPVQSPEGTKAVVIRNGVNVVSGEISEPMFWKMNLVAKAAGFKKKK